MSYAVNSWISSDKNGRGVINGKAGKADMLTLSQSGGGGDNIVRSWTIGAISSINKL